MCYRRLHVGGEEDGMVPDRIEKEVVVDAPVDVVWAIVTEAEHVGGWFSDSAQIDLRPGGRMVLTWKEHGTGLARIERVEPPNRFSFRWGRAAGVEPGGGNSTLVEFSLAAEGDHTRLRVVESGFRDLDGSEEENEKFAEGNREGWDHELGELVEYVSNRIGDPARG
jgi:uncharacterized protein YndB with AHSA1/START domain